MCNDIAISFIIPCKNEEDFIKLCIGSILREVEGEIDFEIIVLDNGSWDNTLSLISSFGEKVLVNVLKDVSISELRNQGTKYAKYDWLAFIDADVELINGWLEGLRSVLEKVKPPGGKVYKVVTGATYSIPDNPTWVQRVWFKQLTARDSVNDTYINGGNLIVNKKMFEQIGGFDSSFKTGEDVQFCKKVIDFGGILVKDKTVNAAHHGYPHTLRDFFSRERWHGLGMEEFLGKPWQSRDIMFAYYYLLLGSVSILFSVCFVDIIYIVPVLLLVFLSPVIPLAIKRSNSGCVFLLQLTILYVVYGVARSFSLVDIFAAKFSVKKIMLKLKSIHLVMIYL